MELNKDRVYTIEETAEILQVHPDTVSRFIRDGKLPCAKLGDRTIRVQGGDIQMLLDAAKKG